MTENQNNMEFLQENDLKEIKIEEVEKLLSLIKNDEELWFMDYNFNELGGDSKKLDLYESEIMEKIHEIENKTNFIEELLKTVKEVKSKNFIGEIPEEWVELWLRADLLLLNSVNENTSKESIIEEFNLDWNKVKNNFLQIYIKEEAQRLEEWWEKNSWTYLLLSYIKKETNILADINNIHNTLQDKYIDHIIWSNKWFNDFFLKWYNNETSNYLIKISDFEGFLSKSSTEIIWENDNPNVVNSRALANYFLYLENKNMLNIDTLKEKMSYNKIDDLYKIWKSEERSIAKDILNKNWLWEELENIHHQLKPISELREHNDDYIENINNKDSKYLYENPELIPVINNENKILSILEIYKENGDFLDIKEINPELRWKIEIIKHDSIDLWYWWLQEIPKNILEDNLWIIIRKYRERTSEAMVNELLIRSAYLWVDSDELSRVIKDFNINVNSEYVKIYTWEYLYIEKNDFRSVLSKYDYLLSIWKNQVQEKINIEDRKVITNYILQNIDSSYAQYYMSKLIWLWYFWEWAEFIRSPNNNVKINKLLIEKNHGFFNLLPKEIRWNKVIIETMLNKIWEDENGSFEKETFMEALPKYFSAINTDNINRFLQVLKFTSENSTREWWIKNMPIEIKEKILNDKTIALIIWNIEKWMNSNIENEYMDIYDELISFVSKNKYAIYYKDESNQIQDKAEEYTNNENINEENIKTYKNNLKELLSTIDLWEKSWESDLGILNETIDRVLWDWKLNGTKMNIIYLTITTKLEYQWLSEEEKESKIEEILKKVTESFSKKLEEQETDLREEIEETDNIWSIVKDEYIDLLIIDKYNEEWETIKSLNWDKLNEIFNQNIQWKTDEEIEEIKNEIIEKYFVNLDQEKKEQILELFENYTTQIETEYASENIEDLYDYYSSNRKDISFRDYLIKEKWINIEKEVKTKNQENSTNNNSYNTDTHNTNVENKWYNPELWIIENNGNKIELTRQEKQIVESSPEAIDNIINFYNMLNEVWLTKLWNIKDKIFNSIANVEWIWFNLDGDYLNQNEVKIFFNSILKSLDLDEIPTTYDIKDFKWELLDINKTQVSGNQQRDFIYGETYLENMFIERYYPRSSTMELLNSKFENAIK